MNLIGFESAQKTEDFEDYIQSLDGFALHVTLQDHYEQ
jgi:hypothetical protein